MLPKAVFESKYIKMSSYSSAYGIYGNEAVMEVVASRIGSSLGVNCVRYELVDAGVLLDGKKYITQVCMSDDFRKGRETIDFESFYLKNRLQNETPLGLVERINITERIYEMLVYDYIICNIDRHGKNIEIFTDNNEMAPLFDNGFCLMSKVPDDILDTAVFNEYMPVNNYVGLNTLLLNLKYVASKAQIKMRKPNNGLLFEDLADVLSCKRMNKILQLIDERYAYARSLGVIQ
jgi:hypothetical protein